MENPGKWSCRYSSASDTFFIVDIDSPGVSSVMRSTRQNFIGAAENEDCVVSNRKRGTPGCRGNLRTIAPTCGSHNKMLPIPSLNSNSQGTRVSRFYQSFRFGAGRPVLDQGTVHHRAGPRRGADKGSPGHKPQKSPLTEPTGKTCRFVNLNNDQLK